MIFNQLGCSRVPRVCTLVPSLIMKKRHGGFILEFSLHNSQVRLGDMYSSVTSY